MIRPLPFSIDRRPLQLRPLTGEEAYEIAASGHWIKLVPEAVEGDGRDWLWERFDDAQDPLTLRSLWRIVHGLSPRLFGVEWWSATRLAGTRELSWMAFEAWSVRHHFEPAAPWVSPWRLTAALMTWLAMSCEKDVEWQQLQMEVTQPPPYAIWLPADDDESSGMDPSSFHANAPHWALTGGKREEDPAPPSGEKEDQEDEDTGDGRRAGDPVLPWSGQPVMSMDAFTAQAKAWAQARRTGNDADAAGAPSADERG